MTHARQGERPLLWEKGRDWVGFGDRRRYQTLSNKLGQGTDTANPSAILWDRSYNIRSAGSRITLICGIGVGQAAASTNQGMLQNGMSVLTG